MQSTYPVCTTKHISSNTFVYIPLSNAAFYGFFKRYVQQNQCRKQIPCTYLVCAPLKNSSMADLYSLLGKHPLPRGEGLGEGVTNEGAACCGSLRNKLPSKVGHKKTSDPKIGGFKEPQLPTLPPGGAVPSAMVSLTSLFGMGRGGSSPL